MNRENSGLFRRRRSRRLSLLILLLLQPSGLIGLAGEAWSEEWAFVGARYQGMGGAGVAVVDDEHAAYWNPGALAFTQSFGAALPVGGQASAEGTVIADIDAIAEFLDDLAGGELDQLIDDIEMGNPLTPDQLGTAIELAAVRLPSLDEPGEGLAGNLNASLLLRNERFSLAGVGVAYFGADPVFDRLNLSPSSLSGGAAVDALVNPASALDRYVIGLEPDVVTELTALFAAAGSTAPSLQAEELVFQAQQAGVNVDSAAVARGILDVANATINATGSFADNNSGAFVRGLAVEEVGIGYGHPFALPNQGGKIGIGAQAKYMFGTTFNKFVRYDDIDSAGDLIDEITDADRRKTTHTGSLDLGILVKSFEWLRFGLTARNVTSPEFDLARDPTNPSGRGKLTLDPQVRAGVALWILPQWVIAFDADLTENDSDLLDGFESRLVSLGSEYKLRFGKLGLALRGGAYLNTVSEDLDTVALTAGLGMRFGHFNFDLAAGASPKTQRVEAANDTQIPSRVNMSLMLSYRKSF